MEPNSRDAKISEILSLRTRFIQYSAAGQALEKIESAFSQPKTIRPRNFLLVGEPNNGKTSILKVFAGSYPGSDDASAEALDRPVLYVMAPPEGQLRLLYVAILRELNVRHAINITSADLANLVTRMIKACGVKMIIVDEFHNILINRRIRNNTTNFLNHFRYMMNEWTLPIVCAGIPGQVEPLISYDEQISSRFSAFTLPAWRVGANETKVLLNTLSAALPFDEPPDLIEREIRQAIVSQANGRLGEIVNLVIEAAIEAVASNTTITLSQIKSLRKKT